MAVDLLLQRLGRQHSGSAPQKLRLDANLVVRSSTP
jgi:DNA-binding LacI/PurR family transcriptional regulator